MEGEEHLVNSGGRHGGHSFDTIDTDPSKAIQKYLLAMEPYDESLVPVRKSTTQTVSQARRGRTF
ncbi:hypothetical protein M413DRAFT_250857 [Hebeloma cylindrosporum]|uniref:Uncharacterized protein n=1 Tax=Hebeloma cylindrosporum TaxID=76867 RepID=A0A0C2XK44_HEBCY|nr:hypothetical protein M413DRAFT_250857 [Hebeloma cylindrosporum h7]